MILTMQRRFSDEIIAMKEGEIVTTGSPEEIITNESIKRSISY